MKREIITTDNYGRITIPSDTGNIWMNEMELGRAIRGNRPDAPCRHPCRVQVWSFESS